MPCCDYRHSFLYCSAFIWYKDLQRSESTALMSKLIFEVCAMQRFLLFGNTLDTPSLIRGLAALGTCLENVVSGHMVIEFQLRRMMYIAMQINLRVREQWGKKPLFNIFFLD